MKIAIVGTGAMGSVYAALFASAGHELWAIDRWREHVDAMRARGLTLEGASGERTVRVNATTDPREAGPCDLVILATKAMHVAQAAASIPPLLKAETPVLSIQNGLGGPQTAASVLGSERVMVGVVGGFGASMRAPAHAECTIGEVMSDPDLSAVSAACATEGFSVAKRKGVHLGFDDPVAYVRDFGSKIPNARPSVLLDLMAKRK